MQARHMEFNFCSSRDGECCLSAISIIHRQAGIFRSLFVDCRRLRLYDHRWPKAVTDLIRRTGGLHRGVSFACKTLEEKCTHNILSVSFKTLQAPADENSENSVQSKNLR